MTASMNERTHFFIKIYLSHFILERVDVGCVWGVSWRQGQDCYILTQVLLTIAALLSHLGWGCSTVGHWGPKALSLPLALTSASCPQLTPTDSSRLWHLVILLFNVHLLPLFLHVFTQVRLLIDGPVEGQSICYMTIFTNPSARAGYDTRSIFKRSLTGLNSEFSFS